MNHLTEEQLEELLLTGKTSSEHLGQCEACRQRLADMTALRNRLKAAFDAVLTPQALEDRIRNYLAAEQTPIEMPRSKIFPLRLTTRNAWVGLAAVLALGFSLLFYFANPSFETTAQAQLVQAHQANLATDQPLYQSQDPEKLAAYLKTQLGFVPQPPKLGAGMTLRGCGVRNFCRKEVATYVLDTPTGTVSIVVIPHHPNALGLKKTYKCAKCSNCTCWVKSLGKVNLSAVRLGNFSYVAVGPQTQEKLNALLIAAYPAP